MVYIQDGGILSNVILRSFVHQTVSKVTRIMLIPNNVLRCAWTKTTCEGAPIFSLYMRLIGKRDTVLTLLNVSLDFNRMHFCSSQCLKNMTSTMRYIWSTMSVPRGSSVEGERCKFGKFQGRIHEGDCKCGGSPINDPKDIMPFFARYLD